MEARTIDSGSWGAAWGDISTPTYAGQKVTRETSLSLLTVYGCVKFIADGIATLPIHEYRGVSDGTRVEISPKTGWLERPTPDLDTVTWLTQLLTSLLLDGNAYVAVDRLASYEVAAVLPLDAKSVQVVRDRGRKRYLIGGFPADNIEIHHIPALSLAGSDVGLSPIEMARQTLGGALGADEFANRWFAQGMSHAGVIEAQTPLTPEQMREMAKQAAKLHGGSSKSGLPMVLTQAAWKPMSITAEQAQFLETRQFTAAHIASMMFNVDPADIGLGSAGSGSSLTYANLEQRNTRRVQVTYMPWIVRLEKAISRILAGSRYVKFNLDALLRADLKTRYESYAIAQTINTAAAQQGEPPLLRTSEMREFEDLDPAPVIAAPPTAPTPGVAA